MIGGDTVLTGLVQGYKYTYASDGTTYTILSTPLTLNQTGTRSFFVDGSAQIRHCTTALQDAQADITDPTIDVAGVPGSC